MNIARRLRWSAATTLGLVLVGFGLHFPGSFDADTWQIGAMVFGGLLGAMSGLITGVLQSACVRCASERGASP